MAGRLEKDLQTKCLKYLKSQEIYNINIYGSGRAAKGAPDIIACINGLFVAFELKVGTNDLQDNQKIHKRRIERSHGLHFTPRTFEEFKKEVDKCRKDKRLTP